MAKALNASIEKGIKISLVDINKSGYSFKPDLETNTILFGLKGLDKVGDPVIEKILENRPYQSLKDFMQKCPIPKTAIISLIKAGAFDSLEKKWVKTIAQKEEDYRKVILAFYLMLISDFKKKLTLSNFSTLAKNNLIPPSLDFCKRVFLFNKYLKAECKKGDFYELKDSGLVFFEQNFDMDLVTMSDSGVFVISQKDWQKKYYDKIMDEVRLWLKNNEKQVLQELNSLIFKENWEKYAKSASVSAWEMEVLCFYYHNHELINVDNERYGIKNFKDLISNDVAYYYEQRGRQMPIYKICQIAGTVISKKKDRSMVTLLTTTGVVNVKLSKDMFALFDRQISQKQADGTKKVIEKSWFNRGTKLIVSGYRRDDQFIVKVYKRSGEDKHHLYKIDKVLADGSLSLTTERAIVEE